MGRISNMLLNQWKTILKTRETIEMFYKTRHFLFLFNKSGLQIYNWYCSSAAAYVPRKFRGFKPEAF